MFLRHDIQPHRTVNSGTGIPAAIRLIVIDHFHPDHIFFPEFYIFCCIYIETKIAIRMICNFFAVEIYSCLTVNALKFQNHFLVFRFLWKDKCFLVSVILCLITSCIHTAGTCLASLIQLHGIMRKSYCKCIFFISCFVANPVFVK